MYSDWTTTPTDEALAAAAAAASMTKISDDPNTPSRSNNDLFVGDLFGDDLMDDIYNSSVADDEHHHTECTFLSRTSCCV